MLVFAPVVAFADPTATVTVFFFSCCRSSASRSTRSSAGDDTAYTFLEGDGGIG